ncbi:MAG: 7-carboxy-7-deazaguanine synthase [Cryomorphaceae bacterium]|jgi:7-carboxy-7-deazaguanine synthase
MALLKLAKLEDKPEIFHTLQGEGVSMGVPSVFVRSSLCNLHCSWCDTDYTWNWEGTPWQHETGVKYAKDDYIVSLETSVVADLIASYNCKNIILTGGEPLLQQPAWEEMIQHLREQDPNYRFEVETNGTQIPSEFMSGAIDQWNVSAKLSNSGNDEKLRIKDDALHDFAGRDNTWFKFVIQSAEDLTEVQLLEKKHSLPKARILLMPEGRTEQALQQKRLWLADICRDQGYRFSDRLHIQLWGSKRGV